ncbi:YutD family protein [Lactococcus termiticola]|uniref:Transcriptional regulator n=1 Tax=Lactococcus termiticola TaxID=2169526 RepID=A0A2R5HJN1_9LACT|nr:YutD family protein [Lactococcus termiticola]GBG96848.1 hypothetical protein NtB2_00973 [Lactococcus termiticola]
MPKEVDETKLNYNKYPGEHVIAIDEVVKVGEKTFHLVRNVKEAFNTEKLEQRYNGILDRYDYIVGDWGFEQLRLKGFYSESRKKASPEQRIDHLEDYLNEYCNYGCAYFVLRRIRKAGEKDLPYAKERVFEDGPKKPRLDNRKRNRKKPSQAKADNNNGKNAGNNKQNKPNNNKPKDKPGQKPGGKQGFVIRERKSKIESKHGK